MKDNLSKGEIRKDAVQDTLDVTAKAVGEVATILTNTVRDVASAIGGLATDVFEIRDSARKASEDHEPEPTRVLNTDEI